MKRFWAFLLILGLLITAGCDIPNPFSNKVKIGVNVEQNGADQLYGNSYLKGVQMAVNQVNQAGGINGKTIELVIKDNGSDSKVAGENAVNLMNSSQIKAILGSTIMKTNLSFVLEAEKSKVPFLSASPLVDNKNKSYVYSTAPLLKLQGQAAANFARRRLKRRKALVYYRSGDIYGEKLAVSFQETMKRFGGKVYIEKFNNEAQISSLPYLIKEQNNDVIYMPGGFREGAKLIRVLREEGIGTPILGADRWDVGALAILAGKQHLNNVYYSSTAYLSQKGHRAKAFVRDYQKKYGQQPDLDAALGYDNANFLLTALSKAKSFERKDINNALSSLKNFTGTTGSVTIDLRTNSNRQVPILTYNEGQKQMQGVVYPEN